MKFSQVLKSVALAGVVAGASTAFAAPVTLPNGQYAISGTGALTYNEVVLQALGQAKIVQTGIGGATFNSPSVNLDPTGGVTGLVYDDATNASTKIFTTGGSNLLVTGDGGGLATPGASVNIQNLTIDATAKIVYADVTSSLGASIGGTQIALFNIGSVNAPAFTGAGTYTPSADDLTLTETGRTALIQGLGLGFLGQIVLNNIPEFGALSSTVNVTAVPEPSTYALMGVGLAGVAFMARRRSQKAA